MTGDLWMPGGLKVRILLDGAATGGELCVLEDEPPPGWALPTHRHERESETVYVVDGQFAFELDGEEILAGPGDVVHIPRGVPHGGRTLGEEAGKRLVVFSPAGIEGFFREVGHAEPAVEHDLGAVLRSAAEHGWRF